MAAYSLDLRKRVLPALDGGPDAESIAAKYDVSRAWVHRLVQRRRETGSIAPRKQEPEARAHTLPGEAMGCMVSYWAGSATWLE